MPAFHFPHLQGTSPAQVASHQVFGIKNTAFMGVRGDPRGGRTKLGIGSGGHQIRNRLSPLGSGARPAVPPRRSGRSPTWACAASSATGRARCWRSCGGGRGRGPSPCRPLSPARACWRTTSCSRCAGWACCRRSPAAAASRLGRCAPKPTTINRLGNRHANVGLCTPVPAVSKIGKHNETGRFYPIRQHASPVHICACICPCTSK